MRILMSRSIHTAQFDIGRITRIPGLRGCARHSSGRNLPTPESSMGSSNFLGYVSRLSGMSSRERLGKLDEYYLHDDEDLPHKTETVGRANYYSSLFLLNKVRDSCQIGGVSLDRLLFFTAR